MKKRLFLLIPITVLLVFGLFMVPVKAQGSINDAENDLFAYHSYTEEGNPKIDCAWEHDLNTTLDIKSIYWEEVFDGVDKYNISMEFYGVLNETYITNGTVIVSIFFLVNGADYPSDLEFDLAASEVPHSDLNVASVLTGIANGTGGIPELGVMSISGNNITWTFAQTVLAAPPSEALADWSVIAMTVYFKEDVVHTYFAMDHYGLDHMIEGMTGLCGILELDIPGYSTVVIGVISVITVGAIIRKKYKK